MNSRSKKARAKAGSSLVERAAAQAARQVARRSRFAQVLRKTASASPCSSFGQPVTADHAWGTKVPDRVAKPAGLMDGRIDAGASAAGAGGAVCAAGAATPGADAASSHSPAAAARTGRHPELPGRRLVPLGGTEGAVEVELTVDRPVNEQAVTPRKIGPGRDARPSFPGNSNGEEQYRLKSGHRQPARKDYRIPPRVSPRSRLGPFHGSCCRSTFDATCRTCASHATGIVSCWLEDLTALESVR